MVAFTKDKGTMTEDKYTKTENKKKDDTFRDVDTQKLTELIDEMIRDNVVATLASIVLRKLRNRKLLDILKKRNGYYYDSDGQDPGEEACPRKKKRY